MMHKLGNVQTCTRIEALCTLVCKLHTNIRAQGFNPCARLYISQLVHSLKSYSFQAYELLDTGTFLAVIILIYWSTASYSGAVFGTAVSKIYILAKING